MASHTHSFSGRKVTVEKTKNSVMGGTFFKVVTPAIVFDSHWHENRLYLAVVDQNGVVSTHPANDVTIVNSPLSQPKPESKARTLDITQTIQT